MNMVVGKNQLLLILSGIAAPNSVTRPGPQIESRHVSESGWSPSNLAKGQQ